MIIPSKHMSPKGIPHWEETIVILSVDYFLDFLFFVSSLFFDALRSLRVVITPLTIIGKAIANKTITNSFGISETASSAVFNESSDVIIIWNIMVGMNQTDNPKINQYSPFNDFLFLGHFIIYELQFFMFSNVILNNLKLFTFTIIL